MAVEDYAGCVADRIGVTIDTVLQSLQNFSADEIKRFLSWWRHLSDADRGLAQSVAGIAAPIFVGIVGKALGAFGKEFAAALTVLVGFTAWGALLTSLVLCEPQLSV